MLGTWFFKHSYCTNSDILLFLFLLSNVLIVSRFGEKFLLPINVNVKKQLDVYWGGPMVELLLLVVAGPSKFTGK